MKKMKLPSPYKQGNVYYFKATINGVRRTFSTSETTKDGADRYIKRFMSELDVDHVPVTKTPTVESYIKLFTDTKTNPKYKQARITESHYGDDHAKHIVLAASRLLDLIPREILKRKISLLTRQDCIKVRDAIHKKFGNTSPADNTFRAFKSMINFASEEGWTKGASPALRLSDIKYKKTKRIAIPIDDIVELLNHEEYFYSEWEWLYLLSIASTGMRRSEAAALHAEQFKLSKGVPLLKIDRARKDSSWDTIGEPKWGIVRTIPVPKILWTYIKPYVDKGGSIFPDITRRKIDDFFARLKCYAPQIKEMEAPELFKEITPHILRHSLNTALLIEGINEIMIQEYFAWKHQDNTVQEGYTHLYARNLIPVAEAIDSFFGFRSETDSYIKKAPSLD